MRQGGIWFAFPRLGKDALFSDNGAHRDTDVADDVDQEAAARFEVEFGRVVWAAVTDRRRPIVAVLTSAVESAGPVGASSGQEDTIAIDIAGELSAVHAIERCPFAGTVVYQLINIIQCGHTPIAAPFHMCHVVLRTADV